MPSNRLEIAQPSPVYLTQGQEKKKILTYYIPLCHVEWRSGVQGALHVIITTQFTTMGCLGRLCFFLSFRPCR